MSILSSLFASSYAEEDAAVTIEDTSSNSHTLTFDATSVVGVTDVTPSGYDASISFDGSDDGYITVSGETFLDDSLTRWQFECFFYINSNQTSGDMGMIVDQYLPGQSGRLLFGWQSSKIVMRVNGGTVYLESGSLSIETWYHVLLNWDGTTHRLFIDGTLADSNTSVPAIYTGVDTMFGGQSSARLSGYDLDGYLQAIHVQQNPTSVRTSSFTPPTTISSGSGTELLIVASIP